MASSTVVGMLRVLLSANVAEFEAGMKRGADVAKQTGKAIEGAGLQSSKSAKYFNDLAIQVKTNALAFVSATAAMGAITGVLRTTIGEFINLSGQLTDISAQTGLTVTELQRLKYAGDLVGVSIETFTQAISQLQKRLGEGDEGALGALRQLGLSWDELKDKTPHELLLAIADSSKNLTDQLKATAVQTELFGRSGPQLLRAFRAGLKETGDEAERLGIVMSEDVISAGDQLGDLWTRLKAMAVGLTAQGLRPLLEHLQKLPAERERLHNLFTTLGLDVQAATKDIRDLIGWWNVLLGRMSAMPSVKPSQAVKNLFGENAIKAIKLTDQELKDVYATLAEGLEVSKKANTEAERHAAAIRQMVDAYKGTTAIKAAQDALDALTIAAKDGVMIAEMTQRQQDAINGLMAEAVEVYRRLGREAPPAIKAVYLATLDLAKLSIPAVRGLSDEFARLGREIELVMDPDPLPVIRGLGKEFGKVGTVIELETIPRVKTFREILTQTLDDIPRLIQQALTGGGGFKGAGEALLSGLGSAFGAKGFGALFQRWGGSLTSTFGKLFTGIGGALGAAIGPLVSVLADVFHDERWEKVTRDVGRDWGVNISEGLARAIADESKRIGSRGDAPLLFLKELFGEAGGIEAFGLDKAIKKTRDLFSAIDRGSLTSKEAATELGEVFPELTAAVMKTGDVASAEFLELIKLTKDFGLEVEAITDFLTTQGQRFAAGLGTAIAPLQAQFATVTKDLDLTRITEAQRVSLQALVPEIERFGRLTVAAFNAAKASGLSDVDAFEAMGTSLDALVPMYEALNQAGITAGSVALQELLAKRELITANRALIDAAGGLNEMALALSYLNGLNVETMADLEAQGLQTFTALREAGFSERDALQQIVPFLETIIKAHEDLGIPIDENTQKLIDQAAANELLSDQAMSTNDILMQGFAALIEAVGGDLPEAFKKFKAAAVDAAGAATTAINKIPKKVSVDVEYSQDDWIPGVIHEAAARGGFVTGGRVLPFAVGGLVPHLTARGADTVPAMLMPGEGVVNLRGMDLLGRAGLAALNQGLMPSSVTGGSISTNVVVLPVIRDADIDVDTIMDVVGAYLPDDVRRNSRNHIATRLKAALELAG